MLRSVHHWFWCRRWNAHEGLAQAGFDVVMLEWRASTKTSTWMKGLPARLYQEGGLRATDDLSITILQGECVGGTTTINWTTCFRTPDPILTQWQHRYGLTDLTNENLTPHFEAVEKHLNISEWPKHWPMPTIKSSFEDAKHLAGKAPPSSAMSKAAPTRATAAWAVRSMPSRACW